MTTPQIITLGIDIVGIATGLIAIFLLLNINKTLGGKISGALKFFVWGVVVMIAAFLWTIIFTRLKMLPPPLIDIHHLLMTTGMLLFIFSAKKFASLLRPQTEL